MSLIYFYREENWAGSMFDQHISLDGKEVAHLSPGGYHVISVIPGNYRVSMQVPSGFTTKELALRLATVADRSHYVKVGFALVYGAVAYNKYETRIEVLEEELAISQLGRMKLQKQ
jgi:hypothetical protein